jgi:hypothetical protein
MHMFNIISIFIFLCNSQNVVKIIVKTICSKELNLPKKLISHVMATFVVWIRANYHTPVVKNCPNFY